MRGISEECACSACVSINVDECRSVDAIVALPTDREGGISLVDVDRFGVSIPGQSCSVLGGRANHPRIARFSREQEELTDTDHASGGVGCPTLNVADFIGETKALPSTMRLPGPRLMRVFAMELFTKLFGDLLLFIYHCFDRIVIHGYLSGLSRREQVVHFFRKVVGIPVLSKEILSQRTADYQNWVEAFARNHNIPIEWAEKGVRKEDYVLPWLRRMTKRNAYGAYFIFKSMEQGPSFRVSVPKYPTKDPNHRILARQRSRFTHDYFYIRDEVLGPMVMRVATFFPFQTTYYLNGHNFIEQELNREQVGFRKNDNAFLAIDDVAALQAAADKLSPDIIRERLDYWTLILGPKFSVKERKRVKLSRFYAISQIEYCRNFIFKRNFPIHKLFERGCELGLWRLPAHKIAEIFGARLHRRLPGKLATVIDQIEHGHHVFRAYFKHAFLKQYEKFATFLPNELCSNNLNDFGLKKGLDNLDAVRQTFKVITSRFAGFQAQWLNVHVDFPLLQRIALPITIGSVRYPGIKIHDRRVIRLLEVLLHGATHVGGWTAKEIHQSVRTTFGLSRAARRSIRQDRTCRGVPGRRKR